MSSILMEDLGYKSFSTRIRNYGVCINMLYSNLITLDFSLTTKIWSQYSFTTKSSYCYWIDDSWHFHIVSFTIFYNSQNMQYNDKISQPYSMIGCLKTCYKFYFHSGRRYDLRWISNCLDIQHNCNQNILWSPIDLINHMWTYNP